MTTQIRSEDNITKTKDKLERILKVETWTSVMGRQECTTDEKGNFVNCIINKF